MPTRVPWPQFTDKQGAQVFHGDVVAYAVREYNVAVLRIGQVIDIVMIRDGERWQNRVKVQVEVAGRRRWIERTHNIVKLEG